MSFFTSNPGAFPHGKTPGFEVKNVIFYFLSKMTKKCILRVKIPSRGPKNISTYLQYHLETSRSDLKKS